MKKFLTLIFFTVLGLTQVKASHIPGGTLTYECVGVNQFKFRLTLYEDCGTAFQSSANVSIAVSNTCGLTGLTTVSLSNVIYQQEVSQLCPSSIAQSECSGGSLPGIYMHVWENTVTLPGQCNTWTFSYSLCCRNTSTNLVGQGTFYIETTLNSVTAPCNNSVQINAQPIPYVCAGQNVFYSFAATDADNDNLSFALIGARSNATTFIGYQGGYSAVAPIPGITLNATTGLMMFNTALTGNYVVVVQITEKDVNGNVTGTVIQDFQFQVINCTNNAPQAPASLTNYTGQGQQSGPNTINLCLGQSACFDVTFTDADATDQLVVDPFISNFPPGATYTVTGTNPLTINVCVTFSSLVNNILSIGIHDDACPINAYSNFSVLISPLLLPLNTSVKDACQGMNNGSIVVEADTVGNFDFEWYALPDTGTVIHNTNTTTMDSIIGLGAGDYQIVVTDPSTGCFGLATVTIDSLGKPHFVPFTITPEDCFGDNDASATSGATNGTAPYVFEWTNSIDTSIVLQTDPNVTTTATFSNLAPGSYTVFITDTDGCNNDTTFTITAGPQVTGTSTSVGETCYNDGNGSMNLSGAGGTGPYTYTITGPENAGPQASGSFAALTAGNYTVFIVDQNGCADTLDVNVAAAPQVIASFTANPAFGPPPLHVDFINTSANGDFFYWDFGNGGNSTTTNPSTDYPNQGTYQVMMIATDSMGCTDTAYQEILVYQSYMEFPNVFSPNGDGSNDEFHFNAENIVELKCVIFNRWGIKVYEMNSADDRWKGTNEKGQELSDGTYYYILEATGIDKVEYKHNGTVNLFRSK